MSHLHQATKCLRLTEEWSKKPPEVLSKYRPPRIAVVFRLSTHTPYRPIRWGSKSTASQLTSLNTLRHKVPNNVGWNPQHTTESLKSNANTFVKREYLFQYLDNLYTKVGVLFALIWICRSIWLDQEALRIRTWKNN